jgi:hypothetical protein
MREIVKAPARIVILDLLHYSRHLDDLHWGRFDSMVENVSTEFC